MTYEYECAACHHEWEEEQRIKDPPKCTCPKCGRDQAHRTIPQRTGNGFVLQGKGWFRDGYQRV